MTEFEEVGGKLILEHDHRIVKVEHIVYILAEKPHINILGQKTTIRRKIKVTKREHKCPECEEVVSSELILPTRWRPVNGE